ncbi:uncharacterized protein LOC109717116 [Ananas comosus]|uniref:Uncharacterized protein LOC109717116 n=1 Tax=Ananas comosus TaxID=4615 RepID=A0A6P5FRR0_ANACO|nr:uncharacterized protein LOC109717116 [Ananas comosus]
MVRDIGFLSGSRNMSLEEIVAMFLYTLAHHQKNRTIANYFDRSGETVSRQFNLCLMAILKLHGKLLKSPEPISNDCTDENWKDFKNCLGALDGTFIKLKVPAKDKARHRTRKSDLATDVLGCRIIMACALLHNLIRRYMHRDPIEEDYEVEEEEETYEEEDIENGVEFITTVETSDEWTNFRNTLAQEMFNSWRARSLNH